MLFTSKMVEGPIVQQGVTSAATIMKGTSSIIFTPSRALKLAYVDFRVAVEHSRCMKKVLQFGRARKQTKETNRSAEG